MNKAWKFWTSWEGHEQGMEFLDSLGETQTEHRMLWIKVCGNPANSVHMSLSVLCVDVCVRVCGKTVVYINGKIWSGVMLNELNLRKSALVITLLKLSAETLTLAICLACAHDEVGGVKCSYQIKRMISVGWGAGSIQWHTITVSVSKKFTLCLPLCVCVVEAMDCIKQFEVFNLSCFLCCYLFHKRPDHVQGERKQTNPKMLKSLEHCVSIDL